MSRLKECSENRFSFLDEIGYKENDTDEDNLLSFQKDFCEIHIMFNTVSYELTCQFMWDDGRSFTLQDALTFGDIKEFKGLYQIHDKTQLQEGIAYLAGAIKEVLRSINVANTVEFDELYDYRIKMRVELLAQYYVEEDMKKAQQYWEEKRYEEARILYEKHIQRLSKVQRKKLQYIKTQHFN